MPNLTHVPVDRGWAVVMTDAGLSPREMLRQADLPEDLFDRVDEQITTAQYFRLWNAFTARIPDPAFPIAMVQGMGAESFHPMIFAALCSQNLRVAFERIAIYKPLITPTAVLVEDRPEGLFIQKRWLDQTLHVPATLRAIELLVLVQIARLGTRRRIVPVRVTSPVGLEPLESYSAYFGVVPEVDADYGLTFQTADATIPFATASETLWKSFEPELQRGLSRLDIDASVEQRVANMLLETLPAGGSSIDAVARKLGLGARTLQRRLKSEGVLFRDVVRGTREKLAQHYITRTDLAYAEIAFLLGFDEPSSFFRAFRSWTGTTPESVRTSA